MNFNPENYIKPDKKVQEMTANGATAEEITEYQMNVRGITLDRKKYVIEPSTFIAYVNQRTWSKENDQGVWFYNYADQHYDLLSTKKCKKVLFHLICEGSNVWWNSAMEKSYLSFFSNQLSHFQTNGTEEGYLQFDNGILDFHELPVKFRKASPKYFCHFRIPYEYDKNAKCPQFEAFLSDIFDHDQERIDLVQEIMGAALYYCKCMQNLIVFLGSGSNGKSLLANMIKHMLGDHNVSSIALDQLSGSQFARQNLDKKLLNISSEVNSEKIYSTADLKALTGGDSVEVEKKYQNSYTTEIYTKYILLANEMIQAGDYSDGFYRRLIIIPFNEKYEKHPPNEEMVEGKKYEDTTLEMTLKEELPGIFNFAFQGLMRFIDQDYQFTTSQACENAMTRYKNEHNVVKAFLCEGSKVTGNAADKTRSSLLFPKFEEFCKDNHYYKQSRQITKNKFFRMFEQAINEMDLPITKRKHKDGFYYTGIRFK